MPPLVFANPLWLSLKIAVFLNSPAFRVHPSICCLHSSDAPSFIDCSFVAFLFRSASSLSRARAFLLIARAIPKLYRSLHRIVLSLCDRLIIAWLSLNALFAIAHSLLVGCIRPSSSWCYCYSIIIKARFSAPTETMMCVRSTQFSAPWWIEVLVHWMI